MDFSRIDFTIDFFGDELTRAEKFLIVFLSVLLIGLCYYQFLYRPVTREIERCHAQRDALSIEFSQVQKRIRDLERMQEELDNLDKLGYTGRMPSYNSVEDETSFLNAILATTSQYSISFANPSRNGDQVRRNVSLRFSTNGGYDAVKEILANLSRGEFRCLLGDLRYSGAPDGAASVSVNSTFFETMVGGSMDHDLK